METYDAIVLGAGPSGASCASFLSMKGRKVLLLDRARFPREKVCGDGISGRSVRMLRELGLLDSLKAAESTPMFGVTFSSPKGVLVPIASKASEAPGFVCRREVLDDILFQNAKRLCAKTVEGFFATDLIMEEGRVVGVRGRQGDAETEYRAKVFVGADGVGGISARRLGAVNDDPAHQFAGVRAYYEGVQGMRDQIELHFIKDALPGYFWVFPLPGGRANVGLCLLVKDMKKRRINLQKRMEEILAQNPLFKERFKSAKRSTDIKSWLLPLATKRMRIHGEGYVLVGDAASLIDPFTGEGIGNALTSGKVASEVIDEALGAGDPCEKALCAYPERLFSIIGQEIARDHNMQRLSNSEFLFNMVIDKAKRSKDVQDLISNALLNPDEYKHFMSPLFYLKVLFA